MWPLRWMTSKSFQSSKSSKVYFHNKLLQNKWIHIQRLDCVSQDLAVIDLPLAETVRIAHHRIAWRAVRRRVNLYAGWPARALSQVSQVKSCPVIWCRRYDGLCSSSMMPCLLCCPLSALPLSNIYLTSIFPPHVWLSSSFPCPHRTFFSLRASLSSSSHGLYHWSHFSVILLDACATPVPQI